MGEWGDQMMAVLGRKMMMKGYPKMNGFCYEKSQSKMDDGMGYPHDYGNPHVSSDRITLSHARNY